MVIINKYRSCMKAKRGCNERRWKGRKKKQNLAEQAILQESQRKSVYID